MQDPKAPNRFAWWRPLVAVGILGTVLTLALTTNDCGCTPPPRQRTALEQRQLDHLTLHHLREQGGDLSRPTEVRHALTTPDCDELTALLERLHAQGYRTEHSGPYDDGKCLVVAIHDIVPTLEAIAAARDELQRIAPAAEHTGWEALVTPSPRSKREEH